MLFIGSKSNLVDLTKFLLLQNDNNNHNMDMNQQLDIIY